MDHPLITNTSYIAAQNLFSKAQLWELFDGNREQLNIAHECVVRHEKDKIAVQIVNAESGYETYTFGELSDYASRFAHLLDDLDIPLGARVAIMLEPSLGFYTSLLGAMLAGRVAVPLFTLFGPDGIKLRIDDCEPDVFMCAPEHVALLDGGADIQTLAIDDTFFERLTAYPKSYSTTTSPDDMAMYQYTSGTTRELPEAVKHRHRAIVTVMLAALYGTGVRPTDRFMCPSSPAWGHGLWHGTLPPLAMGATVASYRGKFDPARMFEALQDLNITNLSAAATHYRMLRKSDCATQFTHTIEKLSFTGEPLDSETENWALAHFGQRPASFYGTTEVGVILVSYPGADDFDVKPGSLGKPVPSVEVAVHNPNGEPCAPNVRGELVVKRRDGWFPTKDLGHIDDDGYFYHAGRADDVIISAGYTMSAVEIEDILMKHPDVREVAVVATPDSARGLVPKAFVVSDRPGDDNFTDELQSIAKQRLSQHEYPRRVAYVNELPKLPAGKINRKALRETELKNHHE